jgi:hypothetical protein
MLKNGGTPCRERLNGEKEKMERMKKMERNESVIERIEMKTIDST